MAEVKNITTIRRRDNPVAIAQAMSDLRATQYPTPQWVMQGSNWIKNTESGEVKNLYAEAVAVIDAQPEVRDAIVSVVTDSGDVEKINVPHEDFQVIAAGSFSRLKEKMEAAMSSKEKSPWLWVGAGVVALYLMGRK
jgi:hypothetical protein